MRLLYARRFFPSIPCGCGKSRVLTVLAQQVPADALRDAGCRGLHGIASQVGVPGRGLNLGVPEELADHGEAFAEGQSPRREAVSKVVSSHVV